MKRHLMAILIALLATQLVACGGDDDHDHADMGDASSGADMGDASSGADVTDTSSGADMGDASSGGMTEGAYAFEGRAGGDSVSYSGQVARQVLVEDLKAYMGGLTDQIDANSALADEQDEVVAALNFYFEFDSDSNGETPLLLTTEPATLQGSHGEISTGKDLLGKLAGQDTATDHVDWSMSFGGWSDAGLAASGGGIDSPVAFVEAIFETVEENAITRANGVDREGPGGEDLPVYVTASGVDLQQLTQKFLLGAINFHQAADDYLDDDVEGKGLLSSHGELEEGASYTALEHAWDEGFGYFGAARDYAAYTDEELAVKGGRGDWAGYHDSDGDGAIDLTSEYNFGASANAAKRDLGAASGSVDLTKDAIEAFVAGRALLASTSGALTEAELTELRGYRDAALGAWEGAIAATAIHYINDTIEDMEKFGEDDYDFLHHAKVWSELKGFSLSFQFNPRSPLSDEDFEQLHVYLGDAPVLGGSASAMEYQAYIDGLLEARALLRDRYGFTEEDAAGW